MTITAAIHIRWMIRRDLPDVLAIEKASPGAWTEDNILAGLRASARIGMIAESGDEVVGWMLYQLGERGIRLHRLAVHPERRRCGVGRQLLEKLFSKLIKGRRERMSCWVGESNLEAHLFLRACGWEAVKIENGRHGEEAV